LSQLSRVSLIDGLPIRDRGFLSRYPPASILLHLHKGSASVRGGVKTLLWESANWVKKPEKQRHLGHRVCRANEGRPETTSKHQK